MNNFNKLDGSKCPDKLLANPVWLSGGKADSGIDYCEQCAKTESKKYGPECIVDGGRLAEHDTPPQCEICMVPLAGSLTDGMEIEMRDEWHNWCQKNED